MNAEISCMTLIWRFVLWWFFGDGSFNVVVVVVMIFVGVGGLWCFSEVIFLWLERIEYFLVRI